VRYFLASELVEAGCDVTFGDFMFALQLPFPVRALRSVRALASVLMPAVRRLPYKWLYPLDDEQIAPPRPNGAATTPPRPRSLREISCR
jgi:hypothetical protein